MTLARKDRVCVIGAGPCGMSVLYQFGQLPQNDIPEIICYEKQSTWGGLWNLTWRTGYWIEHEIDAGGQPHNPLPDLPAETFRRRSDQYGEPCHGGMYKHLWSNGPKECLELPDYTFEEHFGKSVPSYPPRPVLRDYLEGRWTKKSKIDLRQFVKFNSVVRNVHYSEVTDDFVVTSHDLVEDIDRDETFSHVVVAVGIFNAPNIPEILGVESFVGRVMHSHDFRDAKEFKGQRLLVVGASYSAEDVALQCLKFGAKSIICTWRSKPMGFKWPQGIEERPLVQKIDGNVAHFKDGSTAEVDAIILCTGYRYSFPFMEERLRLKSTLTVYPDNLYKGTVWTKGGNNKVFYIGVQDQYYTFTMFDAQACWAVKYILGKLPNEPHTLEHVIEDIKKWVEKCNAATDCHKHIDFQTDFIASLADGSGYNVDVLRAGDLLHTWEHHKDENILTYRDQIFSSIFTGTESPKMGKWFEQYDDSIKSFTK